MSITLTGLETAALLALWTTAISAHAQAEPSSVPVDLRVIYAHSDGTEVDYRVQDLLPTFASLRFTSYVLKSQGAFALSPGTSIRAQLPDSTTLEIATRSVNAAGQLRLDIEIKKIKFKTTVAIAPGATLAVGGPPYEKGALIFALTRPGVAAPSATPSPAPSRAP
jgi:hypothetical protein